MQDMPNIPELSSKADPEVKRAMKAVKSWFNLIGKIITDSELTGTGAFSRRSNGTLVANIQTLDTTTPPQISGLTATAALNSILLSWTPPQFLTLARVEIWRSTTDDLNTAGMVGTTGSTGFLDIPGDGVSPTTVFYYWVRIVSSAGVIGPFNATAGEAGSVSGSSVYLLEVLAGQIDEPELTTAFNDRITALDNHAANSGIHHAAASASADVTVTATGTAGATYTAAEQTIINALVADVASLRDSLNDLKAKLRVPGTLAT